MSDINITDYHYLQKMTLWIVWEFFFFFVSVTPMVFFWSCKHDISDKNYMKLFMFPGADFVTYRKKIFHCHFDMNLMQEVNTSCWYYIKQKEGQVLLLWCLSSSLTPDFQRRRKHKWPCRYSSGGGTVRSIIWTTLSVVHRNICILSLKIQNSIKWEADITKPQWTQPTMYDFRQKKKN